MKEWFRNAARWISVLVMSWIFCSPASGQSPVVESIGDAIMITPPASALGATLGKNDKEGLMQFAKGFLLNQTLTMGMKEVINKPRPFGNGDYAFPSGHTSATFQAAAFIQRRYGWKFGLPSYILAAYTGYSRIYAKRHDGWDVLAGALVGISSSYIFTSPFGEGHLEITLSHDSDYSLVGIRAQF